MNRVVITGLGIVSSIGNNVNEVLNSLWHGRSGIVRNPEMEEYGFRCCLYGPVRDLDTSVISKGARQTMPDVAQYATIAALEALDDAGLSPEELQKERTGIIVGTCFSGIGEVTRVERMIRANTRLSRAGAVGPVKIMNSTVSGNLAKYFETKGRAYSVSTACCTGADNIGHAFNLVKYGLLDVCISGGAEEDTWKQIGASFENSGEMPRAWNDRPAQACRPYDRDRQGFVLSSGAGVVILESMESAQRRRARIYGEILGYGSTNDGVDMYRPTGEGLQRAIQQALNKACDQGIESIDYINTHGTGTQIGDMMEVKVIRELFGKAPLVSSTKSQTGHALGAAGAIEVVLTLLMITHNFAVATANLDNIAPECTGIQHLQKRQEISLKTAMTLNSGLGGTNSCLIFRSL
jgi:3-oxoacyl-[acyl-carrier-protein] synthase-1